MTNISAYAAQDEDADLKPFDIERRDLKDDDVQIEIDYCGEHDITCDIEMINIQKCE